MEVCKNCFYWKFDMKGLCILTDEGVGQLWRCEKWQPAFTDRNQTGVCASSMRTAFGQAKTYTPVLNTWPSTL